MTEKCSKDVRVFADDLRQQLFEYRSEEDTMTQKRDFYPGTQKIEELMNGFEFSLELAYMFNLLSNPGGAKEFLDNTLLDHPHLLARYFKKDGGYSVVDVMKVGREIQDIFYRHGICHFSCTSLDESLLFYLDSSKFIKMIVHKNHMDYLDIDFKLKSPCRKRPVKVLNLKNIKTSKNGEFLQTKFVTDLDVNKVIDEIFLTLISGGIEVDEKNVRVIAQMVYIRIHENNKYTNKRDGRLYRFPKLPIRV